MEVSGELNAPVPLPSGKTAACTNFIAGWVWPRTGLVAVAKKKNPCLCRKSKTQRSAPCSVATVTELRRPVASCQNISHTCIKTCNVCTDSPAARDSWVAPPDNENCATSLALKQAESWEASDVLCTGKWTWHVREGRPGSSVCLLTRLRAGRPGFSSRQVQWRGIFSSPRRSHQLWRTPSLLDNIYQGHFPRR
jgi:hypothetical protein